MRIACAALLHLLLVPQLSSVTEPRYRIALISTQAKGETLEQMAARRVLQAMGIPYDVVSPTRLSANHPLAILPGPVYNATLSPAQREAVFTYVSEGGVLLATQMEGSDYFTLLGVDGAQPRRDRFAMSFQPAVEDEWLRYLDHPKERQVSLGNPALYKETIVTVGYKVASGRKLAAFADGTAAAVVNDYDSGQVLGFGASFTQTVLLAQIGQTFEAGRQWVNSFEPSGDVMFLLVKGLYESVAEPAVYWHTVPRGLDTSIVITHDVDAQDSFRHSVDFARMAQKYGVFSTFFVTTKTFTDASDIGYFDATRIPHIVAVKKMGFEIGSHSLSHSRSFSTFPMGSMSTTLQTYKPAVAPTVIGEVKVSKELLDRNLPSQETISFRAGELRFPPRLIEALALTGYRYDSTFSSNNIITNFPFFAFERRSLETRETRIVEIPVTVDDSQGYLTAATKNRVVQTWAAIIDANRANAAMTCILIHPTEATYKLWVLEELLKRFAPQKVWIGTVAAFGDFWSRRAAARFQATLQPDRSLTVRVDRDASELRDLVLVVKGHRGAVRVVDRKGLNVPLAVSR
jgi:peptidoglycan/xylan/chitin deacetylase (PgdA/CDA1 family)